MAYSKKPTYSFPDINSTGINKIPQGRVITVDDYSSGKPKMFLTKDLNSLNDRSKISDAINQGLLIENSDKDEVNNLLASTIKIVDEPKNSNTIKVFTVGTSGADFDNLQDAINEAIKYQNSIKNTGVNWRGPNGLVSFQVIVMLVTDIDLPSQCQIGTTCGTIFIDLNKKTVYCANEGFAISALSSAFIYNGTITKRSYQSPYSGIAIANYGQCLVGSERSFINGTIDSSSGANGYVTIKGFNKGCWNVHWGKMSIIANVSDCTLCIDHYNTIYTYVLKGSCSSNQSTDGTGAIPINAQGSGILFVAATTITSNIPTSGRVQPCINISNGVTATVYATINNKGIATKCNVASNKPSANGIIYTNLF